MSRLASLMLAAAALIASAPAAAALTPPAPQSVPSAQVLPPAAFTSGPVRADARRLAELLMPEPLFLDLMDRAVSTAIDVPIGGYVKIEPALREALRSELQEVTRVHEKASMPATHNRYARALASHFAADEVAQLTKFYGSRVGQKMIVGKLAGIDLSGMVQKLSEHPDADVSAADIESLNRDAMSKVFEHLDKSDMSALVEFAGMPVFAKLSAFTPTINALEAQIASEPDPELDSKIEAAIKAIMAKFPAADETT